LDEIILEETRVFNELEELLLEECIETEFPLECEGVDGFEFPFAIDLN